MIALAVLAAAGQAMHEALVITAGLVIAALVGGALGITLAAITARRTPRDRKPSRLDEALHGPPSFHEQALLEAIERGELQDPGETGSDK